MKKRSAIMKNALLSSGQNGDSTFGTTIAVIPTSNNSITIKGKLKELFLCRIQNDICAYDESITQPLSDDNNRYSIFFGEEFYTITYDKNNNNVESISSSTLQVSPSISGLLIFLLNKSANNCPPSSNDCTVLNGVYREIDSNKKIFKIKTRKNTKYYISFSIVD
jgi:hypothetical protein